MSLGETSSIPESLIKATNGQTGTYYEEQCRSIVRARLWESKITLVAQEVLPASFNREFSQDDCFTVFETTRDVLQHQKFPKDWLKFEKLQADFWAHCTSQEADISKSIEPKLFNNISKGISSPISTSLAGLFSPIATTDALDDFSPSSQVLNADKYVLAQFSLGNDLASTIWQSERLLTFAHVRASARQKRAVDFLDVVHVFIIGCLPELERFLSKILEKRSSLCPHLSELAHAGRLFSTSVPHPIKILEKQISDLASSIEESVEKQLTLALEKLKKENEQLITSTLGRMKTESERFVVSALERMKQTLAEQTIQQGGGQLSVSASYTPPNFTVQEWLSKINLSQLWPTFQENGLDLWDAVILLTDKDLKVNLNVKLGHTKLILAEINKLHEKQNVVID